MTRQICDGKIIRRARHANHLPDPTNNSPTQLVAPKENDFML